MKSFKLSFFLFLFFTGSGAKAEYLLKDSAALRLSLSGGYWNSVFSQSGFGLTMETSSEATFGYTVALGTKFLTFPLIADFTFSVFQQKPGVLIPNGNLYSSYGFNLGTYFGPLEPYVGYEDGMYSSTNGLKIGFKCKSYLLGLALNLPIDETWSAGFKAERIWASPKEDTQSPIHSGYATHITVNYLAALLVVSF